MKMSLPISISLCIFLLAVPFLGSNSTPQEAVRLQRPLQHEVAVTLKLVQVYVTAKKGQPVEDLKPEDFTVYDNGRKMTITEFEKHFLSTPEKSPELKPAEEKTEGLSFSAFEKMSRKYLLFFDFANNNPQGVTTAREAALHFIDTQLQPGDEVGVLSYSTLKSLTLHEDLTTDRRKVRETVQALGIGDGVVGRAENVEEQYLRQDFGDAGLDPVAKLQTQALALDRQHSKTQALFFLTTMTDFAKALRSISGKKNIIFFSSGIPGSLLYGVEGANFDFGDHVLSDQNEQMIKELSAANCAVFAFDTRDAARISAGFSYEEQTFGNQGRNVFKTQRQPYQQPFSLVVKDDRLTGLYSLGKLSGETGGQYFGNINEYRMNLEQVKHLTGSYYVLGYSIDEEWDGRYHKIKVEVNRKGAEVHAQAGYFNPKPFSEYSNMEKRLHLLDLALGDRPTFQTPLSFSLTPLSFAFGGENRLQLLAKIPIPVIDKMSAKKTELVSLIFDEKDDLVLLERSEADLTAFRGMDVFYMMGTTLPPGKYKCRIVIRDLDTGAAAVATAAESFVGKPAAPLTLYPPLLLVPGSNFVYLEPAGKRKEASTPWKAVYPYDRAQYSPVGGDVSKSEAKIVAVIPCAVSGLVQPSLRLAAYLIDTISGYRRPISFSLLNKQPQDHLEIYYLEAPLENMPPGKYRLYFHAEDEISKSVAYTQTDLRIK